MEHLATAAIDAAKNAKIAYCKFITPNDAGQTGAHQSGFYIHKDSYQIAFERAGEKGTNREKFITIKWQDDFETTGCKFSYYGTGTRNEYRLTRFGRNFPLLGDDSIGSLLVLCKQSADYYLGFVLDKDDDIDEFLASFDISPSNANGIIKDITQTPSDIMSEFTKYVSTLEGSFPSTEVLSRTAREIFERCHQRGDGDVINDPDRELTSWIDTEYKLFKAIEDRIYQPLTSKPADNVENLVAVANMILNRRKSRAGKSLEHHLARTFDICDLNYSAQKETENHNKPDFIMPSIDDYHSFSFPSEQLIFLGAKTTCKDRWRQVLSEADRIPHKHLFTLQPGISSNQLGEMKKQQVTLVVPEQNISTFPPEFRDDLLTLKRFISFAKHTTAP